MNVNNISILLFGLISLLGFSQQKDVYFLLDDNNTEYIISTNTGEFSNDRLFSDFDIISLTFRKEYELYQKKISERKKDGTYVEGYDDFNSPNTPSLDFKIILKSKIELSDCTLQKLRFENFDWLQKEAWKKMGKELHDFEDIYFLYNIDGDNYVSYNVGLTMVAH